MGVFFDEYMQSADIDKFKILKKSIPTLSQKKFVRGTPEHNWALHRNALKIICNHSAVQPTNTATMTVTQLRSFLGMTNYFHDFVEHYANLSYSLYGLLKGNTLKNDLIKWTDDSERAFRKLQKAIVDAPMLFTIQAEGKLTLYTDASSYAAGGHLTQFIQGKECTIAFVSKVFSEVQRRWPTCDQEMFAVYFSIKKLHYLIGGRKFYVKTDHKNLQYWSHTSTSPKIDRWKVFLSEYDFVMEYCT